MADRAVIERASYLPWAERRARTVLSAIIAASLLTGCASPGLPRPPSLHLPAPVTDVTAARVGDRVDLHWTAPTRTTDGLELTTPAAIEVCRDMAVANRSARKAIPCTPVRPAALLPGTSLAVDHLPSEMVSPTGPQALIAYRIRALNQAGRAAEASAPAFVPGGPSPKPVEGFQARQQKAGVVLEWRGGSSNGTSVVEVVRTRLDLLPGKQEPKAAAASTKAGFSKATDAETHLRPEQSPTGPVAAGGLKGMVDGSAASGATYTYAAYRVVTITADGRSYEIRSEPSGPVTMTMRDTFPPEVPRGLVSIPGKGSGSGESGAGATIDLAWESNTEADMAGYIVYRVDLGTASVPGTGKPLRLTAAPILAPAFRDQSVVSGHRYRYTVTSVDLSGNESAPSAAVEDAPDGR